MAGPPLGGSKAVALAGWAPSGVRTPSGAECFGVGAWCATFRVGESANTEKKEILSLRQMPLVKASPRVGSLSVRFFGELANAVVKAPRVLLVTDLSWHNCFACDCSQRHARSGNVTVSS